VNVIAVVASSMAMFKVVSSALASRDRMLITSDRHLRVVSEGALRHRLTL
jgi:hypothetical protein